MGSCKPGTPNHTLTRELAQTHGVEAQPSGPWGPNSHTLSTTVRLSLASSIVKVSGREDGRKASRPLACPGVSRVRVWRKGLFKGEGREGAVTVTERGGGPLCSNASTGKGHSSRKAQTTTQAPKRSGAQ